MAILPPSDFSVDSCRNSREFAEMADLCEVERVDLDKIELFLKNNESWLKSPLTDVKESINSLRDRIDSKYGENSAKMEVINNLFDKAATSKYTNEDPATIERINRLMERESTDEEELKKIP